MLRQLSHALLGDVGIFVGAHNHRSIWTLGPAQARRLLSHLQGFLQDLCFLDVMAPLCQPLGSCLSRRCHAAVLACQGWGGVHVTLEEDWVWSHLGKRVTSV